ncbi:glycosyltransferase involved in cell wall biogenesis [Legionella oakridgensis ATCC 33761 = DSM 21215]|uniref:Glycosyltransferase involved in cell wall biogenesis n=2 Tax=Legionella oakridgensis TaxID=29423 RepID=W0BGQ3_9GAMM|nr:glycosyltransferase involved in cell wall biogenesis [Legionella oakridgensis ATCC 33761 = DSM 21215]ETO92852.1 glycosyltransferase involved in cell wall biogenesis [Legionella oakridgensis RV-2-2007]KTD37041.1 Undecaprenyl-phosphate mannosyltransferase [Legionella oakridgensis]STY20650.1 glycosyltransferase [Legionella longbeachae]
MVVPAYNEETQIGKVIETMPGFVDKIVIIDDCSKDKTVEVVKEYQKTHERIVLLQHEVNQGVGGGIATGYKWARDNHIDVAAVMAGDAQMDPADLPAILDPVVEDKADYSKGNRLTSGEAYKKIPKIRYFGNSILTLLTKIASGYWHITDSQTGYTAINKKALAQIDWDSMYKRYGQPNDLLVRLNVYNFRVKDVIIKPVYNVGEKSGIKVRKVVFSISWLLLKLFFWRLKEKYIIRDFHPLVFFYFLGFFLFFISLAFMVRIFDVWIVSGYIPRLAALAFVFSSIMSAQTCLFAMWMDSDYNRDLVA